MTAPQLGERVRDARTRKGMTQDELARQVQLDRTAVNKIETGLRKVSALELSDIAAAIGIRMASFFEDPTPGIVSHRSSQGLETVDSQIDVLLAGITGEVEFVEALNPFIHLAEEQPWEHPASAAEVEFMAERARTLLGFSSGEPATGLVERLAKLGLLVFTKPMGADVADGGTVLLRKGGVSLVNSSTKVGRRRLTVVHEFAHFLVADEYTIDWRVSNQDGRSEARFDYFARAVLLSPQALRSRWEALLSRSGLRTAAVLIASEFQVDMATLARRLQDLDLADSNEAARVREVRTTQADIIEHDLHAGDDLAGLSQPRIFQQAVLRLVRDERISRERALELLGGTVSEQDLPEPTVRSENAIWEYVS